MDKAVLTEISVNEHDLAMKEQRAKWLTVGLIIGFIFSATVFTLGWVQGMESVLK